MPNQTPQFSDIHKRQLFHWIGGDIDDEQRNRKLSAQQARARYLLYLKDDLEHGLPVKCPRTPERLVGDGAEVPLTLPVACFTEWALSDSRPHSTRYGRMAFGFSKPWIIKHGGQPVSYFNSARKALFLQTMLALHGFLTRLKDVPCPDGFRTAEVGAALKHAFYLLHFTKPFSSPPAKHPRPPITEAPVSRGPMVRRVGGPRPATRYYGKVLEFLEEREWRVVRHEKPYFKPDPAGRFESRVGFELGTELFTLMLPDNELVKMVWQDASLRDRLLNAKVPVTVVSFTDIGTF
jgi:hypothetical protein